MTSSENRSIPLPYRGIKSDDIIYRVLTTEGKGARICFTTVVSLFNGVRWRQKLLLSSLGLGLVNFLSCRALQQKIVSSKLPRLWQSEAHSVTMMGPKSECNKSDAEMTDKKRVHGMYNLDIHVKFVSCLQSALIVNLDAILYNNIKRQD